MLGAAWPAEALLVILRWLHALAAVAFVGWTAVYLLDPATASENVARSARYKEVTEITLLVFLASGAILSFDRLSNGAGSTYAIILAAKVAVSVAAYQFAFRWRRRGLRPWSVDGRIAAALGAAAILLAAVLKGVFENGNRA